jgi:hypothetical protein
MPSESWERSELREITGRLDHLIEVTEKAASRLFWIALPIYLSVAVAALWISVMMLLALGWIVRPW